MAIWRRPKGQLSAAETEGADIKIAHFVLVCKRDRPSDPNDSYAAFLPR